MRSSFLSNLPTMRCAAIGIRGLLFTICSWVLTDSVTLATHLMGGEMSVLSIGFDAAGVPLYEVHCFVYRDCSSANTNGTDFDDLAAVGVFENGVLVDQILLSLDPTLVENINPSNPNSCAFLPEDLCLERAEYVGTVALANSQFGYDFVYQRCCRSPSITNLSTPQDQGFTIRTALPPISLASNGNSTPTFDALPQAFVCNQYPFSISHAASDADGDSLAYNLYEIYLGGDPLFPMPVPPDPPPYPGASWSGGFDADSPFGVAAGVSIDPVTGVMTGFPQIRGEICSRNLCGRMARRGVDRRHPARIHHRCGHL